MPICLPRQDLVMQNQNQAGYFLQLKYRDRTVKSARYSTTWPTRHRAPRSGASSRVDRPSAGIEHHGRVIRAGGHRARHRSAPRFSTTWPRRHRAPRSGASSRVDRPSASIEHHVNKKKAPDCSLQSGAFIEPAGFLQNARGIATPQRAPLPGCPIRLIRETCRRGPVNFLIIRDILRAPRQRSPAVAEPLPFGIALDPSAMP